MSSFGAFSGEMPRLLAEITKVFSPVGWGRSGWRPFGVVISLARFNFGAGWVFPPIAPVKEVGRVIGTRFRVFHCSIQSFFYDDDHLFKIHLSGLSIVPALNSMF
jgi:hypothetical protein